MDWDENDSQKHILNVPQELYEKGCVTDVDDGLRVGVADQASVAANLMSAADQVLVSRSVVFRTKLCMIAVDLHITISMPQSGISMIPYKLINRRIKTFFQFYNSAQMSIPVIVSNIRDIHKGIAGGGGMKVRGGLSLIWFRREGHSLKGWGPGLLLY